MKEKLLEIIANVLKMDITNLEQALDSKEIWDSLKRVEIFFIIEDEFDIVFDVQELSEITTPQQLCEVVMRKVD